jgi:hypothetical protein
VDTGEGGMAVFFAILEDLDVPFVQCFPESVITMSFPDAVTSEHSDRVWPEIDRAAELPTSYPLLAAMCVDSTRASWSNENTGHFAAELDDLTTYGRALYDTLAAVYGREVLIITILDT